MPRKRKGAEANRPSAESESATESRQKQKPEPAAAGGKPGYGDLVLLVHAANLAEGDLYKTELQSHGIPAVLEGEVADVGAGVPVLVPEEFADQAAELIAELESAQPEGRAVAEKEDLFAEDEDEELDELEELDSLDDEDPEEDEDLDDDVDDDDWDDEDDEDDEDEEEEAEEEEEEEEDWDDDDDDL